MLIDRLTKRGREVDVCIEGCVGSHPVIVSIECRDHKRIADVTWVDTMKAKHDRLPTSALILASRSGFTPEARSVAKAYGIKTFTLSDVEEADFPKLMASGSFLWTKTAVVTAEKVLVKFLPTTDLPSETLASIPTNQVYTSDGNELCQISELVAKLLRTKRAGDDLLTQGKVDHVWFELYWEPPRDQQERILCMKKLNPEILRVIESIKITGPCKFQLTQFGMRGGKLGDIQLAWGKTEIAGRDAIVVASRAPSGIEKLSINIFGKQPLDLIQSNASIESIDPGKQWSATHINPFQSSP